MAAGDIIQASGSYTNGSSCPFQPGSGAEGDLFQAFAEGVAELHHTDGTNDTTVDTSAGAQLWSFFPGLPATNTAYYYLKNISGGTIKMWVKGRQTV